MNHTLNPREVMAALPDAVLMRAGFTVAGAPHPLAEQVADMSIKDVCVMAGEMAIQKEPRLATTSKGGVLAAGLASTEFGFSLASGLYYSMARRYDELSEHRAICHDIPVKDYKQIDLPVIDLGTALEPTGENGEFPSLTPILAADTGQVGKLSTYARMLIISREAIISDRFDTIAATLTGLGASASRLENRLVFELLEANPELSDGELLFHADLGNVEASAFDAAALGSAMGKLRTQPTKGGERSGYRAAVLAVAPELELIARKTVHESGLTDVRVISSPNIQPGRWFVLADPAAAPVLGRLVLTGSNRLAGDGRPFRLEPKKRFDVDGIGLAFAVDVGYAIADRLGIVRGGA